MKQNASRWVVEFCGIVVGMMLLDSGLFCILIAAVYAVLEISLLFLPLTVPAIRKPWFPIVLFLPCFFLQGSFKFSL